MFHATIDRIDADRAICVLDDGYEMAIPLDRMPDGVGEGDVIYVTISADDARAQNDQSRARDLLNELLQSS